MEIFDRFNFGKLIKIFLPGFALLIALLTGSDVLVALAWPNKSVFAAISDNEALAVAASIPLSLILGMFSNMLSYGYLEDWLVRKRFREQQVAIAAEEPSLVEKVLRECLRTKVITEEQLRRLHPHLDCSYLLLPTLTLEKLVYTKENHGPYLDFQLTMMVATVACYCSSVPWWIIRIPYGSITSWVWICVLLVASAVALGATSLCLACARKNYAQLQMNMLSLLIGTYRCGLLGEKGCIDLTHAVPE